MVANMKILEVEKNLALNNPVFLQNHTIRQYVVILQIAISVFLIVISILRPWKKKSRSA